MSRTDRHRPHWVQVADVWEKNWYRNDGEDPYWSKVLLHRTCGDKWCGGQFWTHAETKAERHRAQRATRAAALEVDPYDAQADVDRIDP